jgi:predicted nucleotidyltransferase
VLSGDLKSSLNEALSALAEELGSNLYSCCLYGSAVRGNLVDGVSDLNLLIVLKVSDPTAHDAIGRVLKKHPRVDPFILALVGFERSVKAFASKFASIKRTYMVLAGADPLAEIVIDPALERFLCEQALRNLRLRLVFSYATRSRHKSYVGFLSRTVTPLFLRLSEILRLHDGTITPPDFGQRIPVLAQAFHIEGAVLHDLLLLKKQKVLSEDKAAEWHARVFPIVDAAVQWIEQNWSAEPPEEKL